MKIASEMTDQELNSWVAKKVMGFIKIEKNSEVSRWGVLPECYYEDLSWFNPVGNLNHTYLMEEKIQELGYAEKYTDIISSKVLNLIENKDKTLCQIRFYVLHASARQKAEAAYIAFMLQ